MKIIKVLTILTPIILLANQLIGQIAVNTSFHTNRISDKVVELGSDNLYDAFNIGAGIGVDYWFRLKNHRLEFTPELSYQREIDTRTEKTPELQSSSLQFKMNTNVYPLDFLNDCECPTFDKDGAFLKKGFFISVHPGIDYGSVNNQGENIMTPIDDQHTWFILGAGVGFDFGISKLLTITPYFRWLRYINADFQELAFNYNQNNFGVRLSLRGDYLRNQRRRGW